MRGEKAQDVRDVYQALSKTEAEQRLKDFVAKYEKRASKFSEWFEKNDPEGMTFYSFPRGHWKKTRTVNVVERLNQEVKRSTMVARLFPNEASCERLITEVVVEIHDGWSVGKKYLDLEAEGEQEQK